MHHPVGADSDKYAQCAVVCCAWSAVGPEVAYGQVSNAVRGYTGVMRGVAVDPRDPR